MKNWINGLALFAGIVSLGNAVDLEKVRQLQELGFSNEQIVEMLKTGTPETAGGSATQAPASQMSPEVLQHFKKMEIRGRGLVVVVATKEHFAQGPGFLDFYGPDSEGKTTNLGQIPVLDYSTDASKGVNYIEQSSVKYQNKNQGHGWLGKHFTTAYTTTTGYGRHKDGIISQYYGEFELPAGTHELMLKRNGFYMDEDLKSLKGIKMKIERHKKFHDVTVKPGMVTVLSYMWNDNEHFGEDIVMSGEHRNSVNQIASQFGERLSEIKVQHND